MRSTFPYKDSLKGLQAALSSNITKPPANLLIDALCDIPLCTIQSFYPPWTVLNCETKPRINEKTSVATLLKNIVKVSNWICSTLSASTQLLVKKYPIVVWFSFCITRDSRKFIFSGLFCVHFRLVLSYILIDFLLSSSVCCVRKSYGHFWVVFMYIFKSFWCHFSCWFSSI